MIIHDSAQIYKLVDRQAFTTLVVYTQKLFECMTRLHVEYTKFHMKRLFQHYIKMFEHYVHETSIFTVLSEICFIFQTRCFIFQGSLFLKLMGEHSSFCNLNKM